MVIAELIVRLDADQEIGRHQPRALVQQLEERVLAVGARLAPHDRRGLQIDDVAVAIDALAVALHLELLQVGRQPLQALLVRQHRVRVGAEHARVPDAEQRRARSARCVRAARCGSARPSRARRRASARSGRSRRRARSAGRSTTTASSGRRPSPRTRTCSPARCRTPAPPLRWSRWRRSAWRPPLRPSRAPGTTSRAERALAIVSWVVKVFDATMNSVVAGCSDPQRVGEVRAVDVRHEVHARAVVRCTAPAPAVTIAGPRSDPPMPMLTTSVMRRPV